MGGRARLNRLAREVIRPLFDEIERREGVRYIVQTPYDLGGDHVMNDVIYAIDRADIVIADLTDSNPNVFYELGICHSLGRASIALMEERQEKIEFDVRAYRVYKINLDEDRYQEGRDALREPLTRAHLSVSDWSRFENPVIDFFRAPITYISPSFALAQNYYFNFVRPVGEAMIKRKGARYLYDIGTAEPGANVQGQLEQMQLLSDDARRQLELHIVVPLRIAFTKRTFADKLRGALPSALIEGDGRSYTCFLHTTPQGAPALVDIPTTIRGMEDAVQRRMRYPNISSDAPEWREVEQQEVTRFAMILETFIGQHEANPEFARRIRIIRYNPDQPGDLLWLHNILAG